MNSAIAAGVSGLLAVTLAAATPMLAGSMSADYSAGAQYISELGARGAEHAVWVNFGGFLPIAVFILAFLTLGRGPLGGTGGGRLGWWLLSAVAVGYGVAALFQCDAGCPATGSPSQQLHNLGGLVEYAGCIAGLLLIGFARGVPGPPIWLRRCATAAAIGVATGFVAMTLAPEARGSWQRCAEASIFAWIALASMHLLRSAGQAGGADLRGAGH